LDKAEQFDSASGIGIKGVVSVKTLAIGNATLMEQLGIDVVPLANQAEVLRARGASVMLLCASADIDRARSTDCSQSEADSKAGNATNMR
jgi:Cu+-exporting ATPase